MLSKFLRLFKKSKIKNAYYIPTRQVGRLKVVYSVQDGKITKLFNNDQNLVRQNLKEFDVEVKPLSKQDASLAELKLIDRYEYTGQVLKRFEYYKNSAPKTLYYITEVKDLCYECYRITKSGAVKTTLDPVKVQNYVQVPVETMTKSQKELVEIHKSIY